MGPGGRGSSTEAGREGSQPGRTGQSSLHLWEPAAGAPWLGAPPGPFFAVTYFTEQVSAAQPCPSGSGSPGLPGLIAAPLKGPEAPGCKTCSQFTLFQLPCFEDNPWQQREQKQTRLVQELGQDLLSSSSSDKSTVSRVVDMSGGEGGTQPQDGGPITTQG